MSNAGLPEGTVTFLLTDVEGSTRLWDDHPDAMRGAMARHDALVAEAVSQHSGHLLKTRGEGDSTFSVFAQASDAVAAVIELQLALDDESWPDGLELPVRAAVHTGEAELRDGDYFGGTINRAARLRSLGHGGQILLSEAVVELVVGALPEGATLRDLGIFELRGLARPERVHQLCHPGLRAAFAPLVGDARRATNLPAQLTGFIGRQAELNEVRKLLEERRMVTITGPGGAGKTRLAIETAADWGDRVADGVWLVELASITDPALVAGSIAAALGVREQPGQPLIETIVAEARGREQLLVVDNCEHLVDTCAELLETLLRECAALQVLATSRQPVGVRGEDTFPLPPLGLPPEGEAVDAQSVNEYDATRLFLERASLTHAELRRDDADSVATICRRLDGIPLAIELAAARTSVLTPAEIATRLDDRFRLLASTARTVEPRQRTLRGAIDWSHDLLAEPERTLFARLSVFAGSATLEAIEEVCGEGIDAFAALAQLVDKSLVIHERGRYRMLESVHAYASEKLRERGETDIAFRRLFDRLHDLVAASKDEPDALNDELGELRAALEWSIGRRNEVQAGYGLARDLYEFWRRGSHWQEAREWFERARDETDLAVEIRVGCLLHAVWFAIVRGDRAGAASLSGVALELAGEDVDLRSGALMAEGMVRHAGGDFAAARDVWSMALEVEQQRARPQVSSIFGRLAVAAHGLGDLNEARRYNEAALEAGPDEAQRGAVLNNLGRVLGDLGDYVAARDALAESLTIAIRQRDGRAIGEGYRFLGGTAAALSDYSRAEELLERALEIHRGNDDHLTVGATLITLVDVKSRQGQHNAALTMSREALDIAHTFGNAGIVGARRAALARTLQRAGEVEAAREELLRAIEVARDVAWSALDIFAVWVAAFIAADWGDAGLGVALLDAARTARDATGERLTPREASDEQELLDSATAALGHEAVLGYRRTGAAWTIDDAFDQVVSALSADRHVLPHATEVGAVAAPDDGEPTT